MSRITSVSLALVTLSSTVLAQQPQTKLGAPTVQQILLADANGVGPWWGGGVDVRGPVCRTSDQCVAATAFRFDKTVPEKVGVDIYSTNGYRPYAAYKEGKRFPGDTTQRFRGRQWPTFGPDGSFTWTNNTVTWMCHIASTTQAECEWHHQRGWSTHYTLFLLPHGPPPAEWPL